MRRNRRGIALLLVVFAVAIAFVTGLSFLSAQSTNAGIARNIANQVQARQIAESALLLTLQQIQANDNWRSDFLDGEWITDSPLYLGTFSVWVEDGIDADGDGFPDGDGDLSDNDSDLFTITTRGNHEGVSHTSRIEVTPQGGDVSLPYGLFSPGAIQMDNTAKVDSYDSTLGIYGGTNVGTDAIIATASVTAGDVHFLRDAQVNGHVEVGVGGDPNNVIFDDTGSGAVTGTATAMTETFSVSVKEPNYLGPNTGSLTISGIATLNTNQHLTDLVLDSNAVLQIAGDVIILCDGDFSALNQSRIRLLGNATLTVYVKGAITIANGSALNAKTTLKGSKKTIDDLGDPSHFSLVYLGTADLSLINGATLCGSLISLDAAVTFANNMEVFGAVLAKQVTMENAATIHHDLSISVPGGVFQANEYKSNWVEIP